MNNAQIERSKFWKTFDEKLVENGEPFSVLHEKAGETTLWGVINKKYSMNDNALSADFVAQKHQLRLNIYIRDNLRLYEVFESHKAEIESMVGKKLEWLAGQNNPNTRRIAYIIPIRTGYYSNYEDAIDEALPIIVKMKKVCELYAKYDFFDF